MTTRRPRQRAGAFRVSWRVCTFARCAARREVPGRPSGGFCMGASDIRRERFIGHLALATTFVCFAGAAWHTTVVAANAVRAGNWTDAALACVFILVLSTLLAGSVLYQVCRFGYLERIPPQEDHRRGTPALPARCDDTPPILILVPAYREELAVIRQALLSAMLQHQPNCRVVLLIDDPPHATTRADSELLEGARRLVQEMDAAFDGPRRRTRHHHAAMVDGLDRGDPSAVWHVGHETTPLRSGAAVDDLS